MMKKSIVKRLAILATIGVMTMTSASAAFAEDTVTTDTQQTETQNVDEKQITAEQSGNKSEPETDAQTDIVSGTVYPVIDPVLPKVKSLRYQENSETLTLPDSIKDSMECVVQTVSKYEVTTGGDLPSPEMKLISKTWKIEFTAKNGHTLNGDVTVTQMVSGHPTRTFKQKLTNDHDRVNLIYNGNGNENCTTCMNINGQVIYCDTINNQ